jgi:hypothetical protein
MRRDLQLCALVLLVCAFSAPALAQNTGSNLICASGPLTKTYGGTQWQIFGCSDGQSVRIVAAPGNPAVPFTFTFARTEDGYDLTGQGSGSRKTTDAAYAEMQKFSSDAIRALAQETLKPKSK